MDADGDPRSEPGPPPPNSAVPVPFEVRERRMETSDTVTLVLAPTAAVARTPAFRPGQFNMLYAFGIGEVAISISGDPEGPGTLVHTIRSAGRTTEALCASPPGSVVGVRGPFGSGWPLDAAAGRDLVLVAGGLGLPPLRPLLYEILRERSRFGRVEVIYGARSPGDLVFYDEVQRWRARPELRVQTTVDTAGPDWHGDVGVVTARLPDARFDPARTTAFLCGPEIMMRLTARALHDRGVPRASIWLSVERNMKCAVGVCGHCQFGPAFVCRDGPIFSYDRIGRFLEVREL
jgi:NAD(P)H-flavin reductase